MSKLRKYFSMKILSLFSMVIFITLLPFIMMIEVGCKYNNLIILIVGAVANLKGCGKESAAILFWVHIFAVFSMAAWIVLYLAILF